MRYFREYRVFSLFTTPAQFTGDGVRVGVLRIIGGKVRINGALMD